MRPIHGRYLAGVCAGMARATNTDPVLWRVLAVVLTLFGGIGLLLYLVVWLASPAEGDTASPIEALAGRGDSNTSTPTVIVGAVAAVLVFAFVLSDSFHIAVLAVLAGFVAFLLFQRGPRMSRGSGPPGYGYPVAPPAGTAPTTPSPAPVAPMPATGSLATGSPATAPPGHPPRVGYPIPPGGYPPGPSGYPPQPGGGYRPPFAPHGPYGGPPPVPPAPPTPPAPRPPQERSRLSRIVLSLMCIALGVVALLDLSAGRVPAGGYVAVALTVVALGLLVGAWFGRARSLIVLGLVLTFALGVIGLADRHPVRGRPLLRGDVVNGPVAWHPTSVDELADSYRAHLGDATLDLRDVDFAEAGPVTLALDLDAGHLQVLLPPDVDVEVTADVDLGDAIVLDERWGGIGTQSHRVVDDGDDGPGGGRLSLDARVHAGKLEVVREAVR